MMTRRAALASCICGLGLLLAPSAPSRADEPPLRFAVVVAKDSPVTELSIYDLKRAYLGEVVNAGGKRLHPINFPPRSRERVAFDRAVLGMSPDEVARYWIDREIRGDSGPPIVVDSADVMQRVVARLEGGIGYVPVGAVIGQVRVVRIDGKLPGDKDYPLDAEVFDERQSR